LLPADLKITDFGLAKRLDGSGAGPTATGAVLGTPSYMAPEQAGRATGDGRSSTVGPTIDVYALGAILYELLTGRPPFLAASPLDTLLQVTRDEPVPPGRLIPQTPRDIQTICLKCLEKEPSRRYPTAAALADDLRRYLNDEPITARPAGRLERVWKWAKRRPAHAGLATVSVAAVVALFASGWYFTGRLSTERDNAMRARDAAKASEMQALENAKMAMKYAGEADAEALNARRRSYVLAMGQAQLAWQQAAVDRLKNLLRGQIPPADANDLRAFEWHYWQRVTRGAPREFSAKEGARTYMGFGAVAYSPDGRRLVATTNSGKAFLWNVASGKLERTFPLGGSTSVAYRPDGRQIAFGEFNGIQVVNADDGTVAWRAEQTDWVSGLTYTPDGSRLVVKAGRQTRIYDAAAGGLQKTFTKANLQGSGLAVSPDGRRVASCGVPSQIFDIETGQTIRGEVVGAFGVAYSPDGDRLALVANDGDTLSVDLRVVAADSGRIIARGRAHNEFGGAIAFSPDGAYVATVGNDNTTRLWDPATGKEVRRFQGGSRWNNCLAFSPDGRSLAVGTGGQTVEVWPVDLEQDAITIKAHRTLGTSSLALSADAGRVLGTSLFASQIDDAATQTTVVLAGRFRGALSAAFSADGARVAAGFEDGAVTVWDAATGKRLHGLVGLRTRVTAVAFSADGRRLAGAAANRWDRQPAADQPDRVVVWDATTGTVIRDLAGPDFAQVNAVALSADGRQLVTGSGKLVARLWDVDAGKELHTLHNLQAQAVVGNFESTVAISPDGRWAAFGSTTADGDISLYDAATGKLANTLAGHQRGIRKLTFSADGRRLASAGHDDTVRVWDVATGQEVLSRPAPRNVVDLGFSRDGLRLSAVAADGTLRTWGGP
jgi:WD40 repeat protein